MTMMIFTEMMKNSHEYIHGDIDNYDDDELTGLGARIVMILTMTMLMTKIRKYWWRNLDGELTRAFTYEFGDIDYCNDGELTGASTNYDDADDG